MTSVVETLKGRGCCFDFEVSVPESKSLEFSEKFPSWCYTKKGELAVFSSNTIGSRNVNGILNKIPKYASISNVRAFSKLGGPEADCFYSGQFYLDSIEKKLELIEGLVKNYEKVLSRLEAS